MKEENQAIIKALNMYDRVPEQWELLNDVERLNKDNGDITKLFAKEREETKRLHSIIKEVREKIKDKRETMTSKLLSGGKCNYEELLYQLDEEIWGILDKAGEE